MEFFPMHSNGIPSTTVRELVSILTHARAGEGRHLKFSGVSNDATPDHLTSNVTTFPYNAQQCSEFTGILSSHLSSASREATVINDGFFICIVCKSP